MWPQLSSPIERFFVFFYLYHLIVVLNILYNVPTDNVYQRAGCSLRVPLSHAGPVLMLGRLLTDS